MLPARQAANARYPEYVRRVRYSNLHVVDFATITKITTTMDIITITNMASIRMPMHEPMPMTLNDALMVERSPTGKFCYLA